jgi:hypothetical protein
VESIVKLVIAYLFIYIAFLIFSISFVDANTPLDDRILSPVYVGVLILVLYGFGELIRLARGSRPIRYLLIGMIAVMSVAYLWPDSNLVKEGYQQGLGFNNIGWLQSETLAQVSALPMDMVIFTNIPDAINLHTSHVAASLPRKMNLTTQQDNPSYQTEMAHVRELLANREAALVYFNLPIGGSFPKEDEVVQALQVCLLAQGADGNIYLGDVRGSSCGAP